LNVFPDGLFEKKGTIAGLNFMNDGRIIQNICVRKSKDIKFGTKKKMLKK